jgi:hypothetical protein
MTHPAKNFFALCFSCIFVLLRVQGFQSSANEEFQKENDLIIQKQKDYTVRMLMPHLPCPDRNKNDVITSFYEDF